MGNSFGYIVESGINLKNSPELTPDPSKPPSFDSSLGFPNPRKERVMIATKDEMDSAKIPLEDRDYCAHLLIKFRTCRKDNWPFPVNCEHEKHTYLTCRHDDYLIRMKEFERERRLKLREHAKAA